MAVTARSMFIEELKANRDKAGITQEILAQKASISPSLLKKTENGRRRPQRDFALWCDRFFAPPARGRRERVSRSVQPGRR